MNRTFKLAAIGLALTTLAACDDNDSTPVAMDPVDDTPPPVTQMEYHYTVTVTNLTNAQPMSPVAVMLHQDGMLWQIGQSASVALETMAESGDNSALMAESAVVASSSSEGILMPGTMTDVTVMTTDENAMKLTLSTMLVNTNDAFSGLNAVDISNLAVGESMSYNTHVYDAGTEGNSEMAGTIPGPADGGEAFNEARDDVDFVAMHPGVVSMHDGLSTSVLSAEHKFDNPAMKVTIMRMQ